MPTHTVTNQPPPLEDYDLYETDPVLPAAVEREGGAWAKAELGQFGRTVGTAESFHQGALANAHGPVLQTHDRFGHRVDEVEFHPAWHHFLELSVSNGLHSLPFEKPAGEGARVVRDALFSMVSQVESGHGCPISMTTSVVPALRAEPELSAKWEPTILTRTYDPRLAPIADKRGALLGMGMTEKQGGSDVRANTTVAHRIEGDTYRLVGHKWFTSAPMCDAFLVLAQAPEGITCFLLPRVLDDGTRNSLRLQRLKDKLGNRSNASSEVEFDDTIVFRVGEEGRGVPTIIEMVSHTRLDCVVGSVGLMRQAVAQAGWHAAHRVAFGSDLIDKPLMQNVLADLEIEVEVATLMMMRLSGAFDRAALDPAEAALMRVATPVAKYWVTKRCSEVVREAMECLGGNGYVETSILPRLYRESPVNAIWEGSGNVIALDVMRALGRAPNAADAFLAEAELGRGAHTLLDAAIDRLRGELATIEDPEAGARRLVESMAIIWGASLAARHGDPDVADAWVSARVTGGSGRLYGTLEPGLPIARLARRAVPVL
ncbi:MAG TPA: isovaleryl-CoA dehydrogenase [Microthrixaceae bacterium]|nr:isovaleryl-CoA dehydrogenase [Microthrixaceae bacterium]